MNFERGRRVGVAVAAGLLLAMTVAADEATPLARDGTAVAVIVHNGFTNQAVVLQDYLKRITGTELALADADAEVARGPAVVLAVSDAIPGLGDRRASLQGYRIHTENGRLFLTGRTEQGLTYAVYGFLDDHLGVRFFAPDCEKVPRRPTLAVGPLDDLQEPAFLSRAFSRPYGHPLAGQEPLYREKNRGNTPPITSHHNFYQWISTTNLAVHPEWFPLVDGQRRTHPAMALCASNGELADYLTARFTAQMERMARGERSGLIGPISPFTGYPSLFSAGQGDGGPEPCACTGCRALAEREGSEAAPYHALLNRALDRTAARFPSHGVITFAYYNTLKVPRTLRPHSNLWINIVSGSLSPYPSGDQLGPIRDNPHNRDYAEAIRSWPRVAPGRVAVWDWTSNFTDATVEWPNLLSVADNIRFFRENGIEAVFLEQPGGEQNWGWLRKWVWARMLWNPDRDPEALRKEFIEGYYGEKAAPFILEYHRLAERTARESRYGSATVRWTAFPSMLRGKLFPDAPLNAMAALMDGALRAAAEDDDPAFPARVWLAAGASVDTLLLTAAGGPARVTDPRDGSLWLVPGGQPGFPERIDRVAETWLKTSAAGAESWHFRYRFLQRTGGRLLTVTNATFAVEALPTVQGQLYSLVHRPSGKELLAPGDDMQIGGYVDRLPGATTTVGWDEAAYTRHWHGAQDGAEPADRLTMHGVPVTSPWLSPRYLLSRRQRLQLQRDVVLAPGADALAVERRYHGQRIGPATQVFESVWSLAVPAPERASVVVRGGAVERRFDLSALRTAASKGESGDRPVSFTDVSLQEFDFVEGRGLTLEFSGQEGNLTVALDRGDGLTVTLETPAAGNQTVALTPVAAERRLTVAIGSQAIPLPPGDNASEILLPPVALRVQVTDPALLKPGIRTQRNPKDNAEMVWVPGGHFPMGSLFGQGHADESPRRRVFLDGYWIYKHPVTVAQYRAFCQATGRTMPKLPKESAGGDHPVYDVNWHDAAAYAVWAGAALPTEAQWEKAARGTDGRVYPWGDEWDPARCVSLESTHDWQRTATQPVGSCPSGASPCGALDMAGQVWEWTADWYAPDAYRKMFERNPAGPDRGEMKVLRGGSRNWNEWHCRTATRMPMPPRSVGWVQAGFRCVRSEP